MGIGAHYYLAGVGVKLCGDLMADALVNIGNACAALFGEIADEQLVIGKLLGGRGSIMVEEKDGRRRTSQFIEAAGLELPYCQGSSAVLSENEVDGSDDYVTGMCVNACLFAEDFLC
jgi:hypothetical protein